MVVWISIIYRCYVYYGIQLDAKLEAKIGPELCTIYNFAHEVSMKWVKDTDVTT